LLINKIGVPFITEKELKREKEKKVLQKREKEKTD